MLDGSRVHDTPGSLQEELSPGPNRPQRRACCLQVCTSPSAACPSSCDRVACAVTEWCAVWSGDGACLFRGWVTCVEASRAELELDSEEYFMSLAHTARKYWEHPIPKHEFPVGDDGTWAPPPKPHNSNTLGRSRQPPSSSRFRNFHSSDVISEKNGGVACILLVLL